MNEIKNKNLFIRVSQKEKNVIEMDMFPNNEVVYVTPPEQIDETEEICVVDYLIPRSNECIFDYTKVRRFGEDNFTMKIGGTTYEVSTHFNPKGRLCLLEQFKELILSEHLI